MTKHVLCVVLPERGHVHPFLGATEALRARGARVSFYAPRDVSALLEPLGFRDVHAPEGAGPPAAEHRGEAFAALLADRDRLRAWIRAMLVDSVEASIPPLSALLARERPDVVVIDPMAYFAAIAAHAAHIPWFGLSTSLNPCIRDDVSSELVDTLRSLDGARRALFAAHGIPGARFRVSDVLSPRGTFVLSTRALVGERLPDDGVPIHLVGAALPGGAAVTRPSRPGEPPLVYASFGSQAYHQPAQLAAILEGARAVDARFVVAMGELASSSLARSAPSNVEVVAFASQVALLAEARVAITHGGANSVHEGLAHGVPLLVSPICNDQHHDAALVEAAGAGRTLDLAKASPEELVLALRALLAEAAPERAAARAIASSYASAGGAARIAEIVLGAA